MTQSDRGDWSVSIFVSDSSQRWLPVLRLMQPTLPCLQSSPSLEELHRLSYTKAARGRARVDSALPSPEEAEALFQLDADLFTPEAVEGMRECVYPDRLTNSL